MPHLIIEFSESLANEEQISLMLDAVHDAARDTGLFEESHIKTRLIPVKYYRLAKPSETFIHAQLRIKAGRDNNQKKKLSEMVLTAIKNQHWSANVITVEVIDMDTSSYSKCTT